MLRNGHEVLKIETHVLKVHINCKGCKQKVIKLLKKIEGVHSVDINAEHQMVIVSGFVDSATLIRKLVKSGKPAELWSPSSRYELNQEQANMHEMQFIANDLGSPNNQYIFPASFGNEIEAMGSFENYLNQDIGIKAVNARTDQDLMATRRMGNVYLDEDNFAGHGRLKDGMAFMMGHADYQGNGTRFVGLGNHEFNGMKAYELNHLPSMMMTTEQQGYQYNYPSRRMNNIYIQDRHNSNNMINDIYMHHSHMLSHVSSMYPPRTDYNFPTTLDSYN